MPEAECAAECDVLASCAGYTHVGANESSVERCFLHGRYMQLEHCEASGFHPFWCIDASSTQLDGRSTRLDVWDESAPAPKWLGFASPGVVIGGSGYDATARADHSTGAVCKGRIGEDTHTHIARL